MKDHKHEETPSVRSRAILRSGSFLHPARGLTLDGFCCVQKDYNIVCFFVLHNAAAIFKRFQKTRHKLIRFISGAEGE